MGLFVTPALLDFDSKNTSSRLIWLLPHPLLALSCPSKFSIFLNLPVSRRSSLLTGEGEEPNRTTARKPGSLKISQYSLPDSVSPFDQNIRVRTRIQIQVHEEKNPKI
jgi:hypothetical protein